MDCRRMRGGALIHIWYFLRDGWRRDRDVMAVKGHRVEGTNVSIDVAWNKGSGQSHELLHGKFTSIGGSGTIHGYSF